MDLIELDSARFEDLAHAATGPERIPSLEHALGLWRGGAFGEFAELPGVRGEALRLEELRLTVTEQLIDARMEAGEDARMVAELEALVAAHPLREQFWRQLMLALYRSGRQAEALRRCADLRSMLRDEMGLSVSLAARELEARILADDPSLHHHVEQRVQATPVPLARREPTQLIGRADDIETLREELDRHPIVTIVGPGGVGKTRLAMTLADACAPAFAQVVVVELASLRDPDATVQLLASTLDVEQRQHLTLERSIEEFIHDRAVLLVLDNCEHVLGAVVPLVQRLSRHCVRLTVLATGRAPLGLPGELVHVLAPLGVPAPGAGGDEVRSAAAVRLFADRATEARPGFQLDERNLAAAAEICRKLDGLPLAIELAAARMRSIGAEALADRLDQRFALLAGQPASLDPRHHSLHRLVEWSYELLPPADQEAFAHLAAFAGSFDLEAAEVVCRPTPDGFERAARVVIDLVDRSMVQVVDPDEPRYRLLETLREFGQERLRETGSLAPVEERHRGWFLDVAERAAMGLDTPDEGRWVSRIDRDLDNFRAAHAGAVAAGDLDVAGRLVAALREYSFRRVRYEIAGWGEATMHMEGFESSPSAPIVLGVVAYERWVRGDLDAAKALAHQSIAVAEALGEPSTGLAERVLGNAVFYSGATQDALRLDGPDGRGGRRNRPRGRPDPRAVHVVRRPHVGRRRLGRSDAGRSGGRGGGALRIANGASSGRVRTGPGAAGERQGGGRATAAARGRPRRDGREPMDPWLRVDRGVLAARATGSARRTGCRVSPRWSTSGVAVATGPTSGSRCATCSASSPSSEPTTPRRCSTGPWSRQARTQPFPSNPPTPTNWWQKLIGPARRSARRSSTPPCAGAPP